MVVKDEAKLLVGAGESAKVLVEDGDEKVVSLEANVVRTFTFYGDTKKPAPFDLDTVTKG